MARGDAKYHWGVRAHARLKNKKGGETPSLSRGRKSGKAEGGRLEKGSLKEKNTVWHA